MTNKSIYLSIYLSICLLDPRYYEFSLVNDNIARHWCTSRTYTTPPVFC